VTEATTLQSSLSVGGVTNLVGAATLRSTLSVAGDSYISGSLTVLGDIDVAGVFNSISTTATELVVEDCLISLNASNLSQEVNTTVVTYDIGLEISGLYGGDNSDTVLPNIEAYKSQYANYGEFGFTHSNVNENNFHEKSIKWKGASGLQNSAHYETSLDMTNESCWEFRGGGIRMSQKILNDAGDIKDVSYSFRVNANEELELWKGIGNTHHSKVARFGAGGLTADNVDT
jgi:hypothetical protein